MGYVSSKFGFCFLLLVSCSNSGFEGRASKKERQPQTANAGSSNVQKDTGQTDKNARNSASKVAEDPKSIKPLVGTWDAKGYLCLDKRGQEVEIPLEIIKIEEKAGKLVAIKVKGDDCIEDGETTFKGTRNGTQLEVQFYTAVPGAEPELHPALFKGQFSGDKIIFPDVTDRGPIVLTRRKE